MKRRCFVAHLTRLCVAVSVAQWRVLANSSSFNASNSHAVSLQLRAMFAELAYLLLPLQPAESQVYTVVASHLIRQMVTQPVTDKILNSGVDQLNRQTGRPWLSLSRAERKAVMMKVMDTPFIAIVRWITHEQVLRSRKVWAQVGYQGSAIEQGGYLKRGFNDIDWLPAH